MIKSFRHKGLQRYFETGSKAGIQASYATKLRLQLAALDQAVRPEDLSAPSWGLHPLKGDLKGNWSIIVNGTGASSSVLKAPMRSSLTISTTTEIMEKQNDSHA